MDKKIFVYLIGIFVIISLGVVSARELNQFNNSLTTENLTFTGDENITRYLEISRYANVTSAYLNLSGYGPWELSVATYDNVNISTQDSVPYSLFFKPDGTKLYELGNANNLIYQSTCSDAWNLSSCTYDNVNISRREASSLDLFFKSDGTKLYEIGNTNDLIYQSTCSDAWNLSSCSYDNINISTQDSSPDGLFFKSDGIKLYEIGYAGDKIYQYTCSDAWNLSSCTYDSVFISTQDSLPYGLFFKSDGTKLYELGYSGDKIHQYTCSDAWNLSSCIYDNINISTQDATPQGLSFNSDGTKLYEIGDTGNKIYQYTLSYPTEPYLDIGTPDGIYEWSGAFKGFFDYENAWTCDYDNLFTCDYADGGGCSNTYCINSVDENWSTFSFLGNSGIWSYDKNLYENTTLGSTENILWTYKIATFGGWSTIDVFCHNYSSSTWLLIGSDTSTGTHNVNVPADCYSTPNLQIKTNFAASDGTKGMRYYEGMAKSIFETFDFSSALNTALNSGACDCTGCSLSGNNCTIPFLFHSDTAGILEYSYINITYFLELTRNIPQFFSVTSLAERTSTILRTLIQQINIFPPSNVTYNFSGVFNSLAYNNTVSETPPGIFTPAGETEINYTKIETSDDDYATDTHSTEYPYHKFNMSITESNVNYVDVLWEGYTSSTGNVSLYVWNYTFGNWSLLDYGNDTIDFNLTARVSDLNNVRMGSGNITFLVQDGD